MIYFLWLVPRNLSKPWVIFVNMKKYKNKDELIELLNSKGVVIEDKIKVLKVLEKYSYYSVINTYREKFMINNEYIEGVSFDEIFSVYEFDKNLRYIFLKYCLEVEIIVKSYLSEIISSNYGLFDYLKEENFDENVDKADVKEVIDMCNQEIDKQRKKNHDAVKHYLKIYGFIPPYLLIKIISFGELNRFYKILKQKERQAISKKFSLSDNALKQILTNLTLIRNICAHNERLYSFRSKFLISYKQIQGIINFNYVDLFTMIICLKKLLSKESSDTFLKELNEELKKLHKRLKTISIFEITEVMGFNDEYIEKYIIS